MINFDYFGKVLSFMFQRDVDVGKTYLVGEKWKQMYKVVKLFIYISLQV